MGLSAEFASAKDRIYYVKMDPVHQVFVKSLDSLIEKAIVVEFNNSIYKCQNLTDFCVWSGAAVVDV
jgi:hypothetical protein